MAEAIDQLIDRFSSNLLASGVPIRREDNLSRLHKFEARLNKRLPPSFVSLLSRYSFPSFDAGGISLFGWDSTDTEFSDVVPPAKGSLSELLLPAGYLQIGRPQTGSFDAVCFELCVQRQDREYCLVLADHEEILSNLCVRIRSGLWLSFRHFVEHQLSMKK